MNDGKIKHKQREFTLFLLLIALFLAGHAIGEEAVNWFTMEEEYIRLVNKENLLEEDYIPKDLVKIKVQKTSSTAIEMRQVASDALDEMFSDAKEEGLTLYAHSGYRSYRTQNTMYYNRLERNKGKDDGAVAYPGSSDHQTGLGIDVINKAWIGKRFNSDFAKTEHAQWMAENCWRYGFIIRYPQGKEDITQIIYEPWHLRYVGVDAAQYMTVKGLTLEEFTPLWQQKQQAGLQNEPDSVVEGGSVGEPDATLTPQEVSQGEISWFDGE